MEKKKKSEKKKRETLNARDRYDIIDDIRNDINDDVITRNGIMG